MGAAAATGALRLVFGVTPFERFSTYKACAGD